MTTWKLPTVLYKIYAYCNNFITQRFPKTKKIGVAPPSIKKNHNDLLCSRENLLQLNEKIKSLAIILAEK